MAAVSHILRVMLLLAPLTHFAAHVRGADVFTTTNELNRCLSAARVALARRGALDKGPRAARQTNPRRPLNI